MSGQGVGFWEIEEEGVIVRAHDAQGDLRAAVTAVLPAVLRGESDDDLRCVLSVLGFTAGSDRDLAILAGAVQAAKAFVLLGEAIDADPEVVWRTYISEAA